MGEKDLGRNLCFFFPGGLFLTHGTRENVLPMVTEAGIRAQESLPLILSIFSAE